MLAGGALLYAQTCTPHAPHWGSSPSIRPPTHVGCIGDSHHPPRCPRPLAAGMNPSSLQQHPHPSAGAPTERSTSQCRTPCILAVCGRLGLQLSRHMQGNALHARCCKPLQLPPLVARTTPASLLPHPKPFCWCCHRHRTSRCSTPASLLLMGLTWQCRVPRAACCSAHACCSGQGPGPYSSLPPPSASSSVGAATEPHDQMQHPCIPHCQ